MTRGWRLPAVLALVVLLGGLIVAWLQPGQGATGYLDPASTGPDGGHALAAILADRGTRVTRTTSPTEAGQATGSLLVTNPWLLTAAQLRVLAGTHADVVLVNADKVTVRALAPQVTITGSRRVGTADPGCDLAAATLAGSADLGGSELSTALPGAQRCYPKDGHPTLIRYRAGGGHEITVLGTSAPFTNQDLGKLGNAALALNLLSSHQNLVWLTPTASPTGPPPSGQASFTSLIPKPVWMVTTELIIAVVLLALWRMRRLGPLVPERLPVVVRAAETTEGHGRLYRARRSRDSAAAALREAAIRRVLPVLGLPPDTPPDAIGSAIASRTGENPDDVITAVAGGPPADEATLVSLADRLDELERKVSAR
jgi:hypothetical protein